MRIFLINRNNMLCYIVLMFCQDGCFQRLCLIGCSWPGTESAGGIAGVLWHLPRSRSQFLLKKPIGASMQSLTVKASTPRYLPKPAARTESWSRWLSLCLQSSFWKMTSKSFCPCTYLPARKSPSCRPWQLRFSCVFSDREQRLDGCCNMGWCAQKTWTQAEGSPSSVFWRAAWTGRSSYKPCLRPILPCSWRSKSMPKSNMPSTIWKRVRRSKTLPKQCCRWPRWSFSQWAQKCGSMRDDLKSVASLVAGKVGAVNKECGKALAGFLGNWEQATEEDVKAFCTGDVVKTLAEVAQLLHQEQVMLLVKAVSDIAEKEALHLLSLQRFVSRFQHPCEPCLVDRNLDTATNPQIWPNYSWLQS